MSEWQFSKSKFEERHINEDLWEVDERQRMNDDRYEKAFGYDLVSGNLKLKADDLSAEKIFGQQLEKRSLIDKDLLKSKIEQKYNEAFGNKTIWKLTKGKRADHAKNKLRLQDHMREEYETLIEKRNAESEDRMDYISMDMANQLALNYYTNDEKAALREWIIGIDADSVQYNEESQKFEITGNPDTISYAEQLTSDDVQERLAAYKSIFKVAATMDTNQLEYSSDSDFVSNFAKKYDVVCKLASVQVFIDKFKEEGGVAIDDNLCIADLEAKVELAKEYKRDYELRMQLISSPCYALLSTDDVKDFIAREKKGGDMAHISAEFAGFMDIYKKLNNSSVGKRKDAARALEEKIRAKRQQYADANIQAVNKEIPGIQKLEEDQSTDALLMKCYNTKKIEYPEVGGDDYGVILNLPVELKIDKKYPPEMLKRLESNVAEAIRNKSFGGVELKPELHKEFEEKLTELVRYKKSYYKLVKKAEYIRKLRAGLGCDINNPSFKDTHEARILNRLMAQGLFGETAEKNAAGGALSYMNKLVTLADSLDKQGLKAYKEAEEELIIRRNYIVSGPLVDPGSRMELFNVALRSTSQERIKEFKGKQSVTKPGQVSNKLFFEIFKQRYEEKSLGLPEEKDAKLLSKEEWGQISWVMHQLVSKENADENGIDDFKRLWDKKINYQASQNKPVSDRVKANVENLLVSWRETLKEMARRRQQLKEKAALNTQKLHRLKLQEAQSGNGEKRNKKHKRSLANGKRRNRLDDATKYQAFAHAWRINDQNRERIIADKLRHERRNLNMEYTEEERKALGAKKIYVLRKEEPQKKHGRNNFGELYNNSIRDVEAVLRKMKADSYTELDRRRKSDDPKERTIELYHSEGTRLMEEEGHEVLEIDVGGSSYRELSYAQNGFLGLSEGNEYELHNQYGDRYFSKRNGKTMDHIRSKTRYGESEKARGRKKTRFTIAGSAPAAGGILNADEYSIENTTENILEIGSNYLEDIFKNWEAEQEIYEKDKKGDDPSKNRPMVDVMLRGHSRGAVGSAMGEMKIRNWLHEKYPQYENMVKFHITQYDAVPGSLSKNQFTQSARPHFAGESDTNLGHVAGGPSDWEGYDKYLPVGKDAETTAIYSMNTQYDSYFAAQEIRHAKRLIFTPFNHAVGLDVESTDNSQMDQEGEKLHGMTFYDTTTNKAYRQTGLDHLGDGVYVMDEKQTLVKLNSVEEYVRIIQLTVPEPELKEQFARHMSMLHAVASRFDMDDKAAEKLWNDNLKSEEVKKAADDWSVFDVENKVRSIAIGTAESKKFKKAMSAALENRKKVHNDYIDRHVSDENTRKFLKVCTDVCFKADCLCYGIYEADRFAGDSKAMDAAVEEFRKLKDSVKPEGMTEQELVIANAAEKSVTLHRKVMDMLNKEKEKIV